MSTRLELQTPAKINLFLRITARRSDGYHELDSIFLPVSLFDAVAVETRPAAQAAVTIRCNWADLPLDDGNLAYRAARLFLERTGLLWRVSIDLHKRIPAAAGLGGGSSDAGAVLRLLARIAAMPAQALAEAAVRLGADVPFFLDPRPARIGGIGERITYLNTRFDLHLLLAVPAIAVSTAEIYRHLPAAQWSGCGPRVLPPILDAASIDPGLLVNDLERVALARYPQVEELKVLLHNLGARAVLMSGSGGAVFGLFGNAADAQAAAAAASKRNRAARFFTAEVLSQR